MPGDLTRASIRTAVIAISVNIAIALAKAVAAGITGSAALWAETAHSFADTGNELLLLIGLRRSRMPRDARHPFGYGQERWFWAFVAAIGIFIGGGLLSIDQGVDTIRSPRPVGSYGLGVAVLLVSMLLDGFSWRTARRELHDEARVRGRSFVDYLRVVSDPTAPTVFLEDSASLVGLSLALAGLTLQRMTGSVLWDAGASIAIGVLLVVVAFLLAGRSKGLLIDESAPPEMVERLTLRIAAAPWVAGVESLAAILIAPRRLLVTARVVPTERAARGGAGELLALVDRLREDLLAVEVVAEVEIGLAAPASPQAPG
ncbi:MAG: cation diffusion facilitator family transporter [Micromonosporaceae bacterium]|nr:cation diffusion facilitator family transporter [Micromonosporaceae bacterium]